MTIQTGNENYMQHRRPLFQGMAISPSLIVCLYDVAYWKLYNVVECTLCMTKSRLIGYCSTVA